MVLRLLGRETPVVFSKELLELGVLFTAVGSSISAEWEGRRVGSQNKNMTFSIRNWECEKCGTSTEGRKPVHTIR